MGLRIRVYVDTKIVGMEKEPAQNKAYVAYVTDDVKCWHDNLAAGSVITLGVYLRRLGLFGELMKTTPKRILKEANSKAFRDGFVDSARFLESEGKAGSRRFRMCARSWSTRDREVSK